MNADHPAAHVFLFSKSVQLLNLAHMRRRGAKKKQHPDFASGHPRHYYPGPSVLIFSKRNGIRRSTLVWPFLTNEMTPLVMKGGGGAVCSLTSLHNLSTDRTNQRLTPNTLQTNRFLDPI